MSLNASHVRSVLILPVVSTLAILTLLLAPPLEAACPPGDSNPVTSGDPGAGPLVVLGGLGPAPVGSFFLAGSGAANNSGTLPSSLWLERVGDLDGDGLPEIRVGAPGEGPGGWGDPRTQGCPSGASPPHPPLVLFVRHDNEDLDGDGKFDVFEDKDRQGDLDPGEDLDGDGRLTPLPVRGVGGGCEGFLREDIDCDGRLDKFNEDFDGDGRLDPFEDLDRDGHLDTINEDRNDNNILDDRPDPSVHNHLIPDENGNFGNFYPYMAARPAKGSFVIVAVAWDGQAYDLQSSRLGEVRVLAAHPLPIVPPAGCPAAGGPGRPVVNIGSIGTLQSGALDARVSISDPDADPLNGRVGIDALLRLPDLATGGSDLCAGQLLPEGERGRGALFVGSVGLPPMLFDLDSLTGCDDGQPDFGFTYGACGSSSGEPLQSVLTLSCPEPYSICIHRLEGGAAFDYVVHQADPESALLSGASPSLPSQAYEGSRVPRSLDLRTLPAPGDYALTITAEDGVTPIATDSMLFGWNGEKTLYINHPGHRAGLQSALRPEPVPMPVPTPVPAD